MQMIVSRIGSVLGYLVRPCYFLTRNYGLAILLFTLLSKIVLLPISVWVQKNGIKLVKMQPEINWLKVNYYGDLDTIAEKQSEIYKKHKYSALASILPLLVQVVILLGLVEVIYNPLRYILRLPEDFITAVVSTAASLTGADPASSSIQMTAVNAARDLNLRESFAALAESFPALDVPVLLDRIAGIDMGFLGLDLSWIPAEKGGVSIVVPVLTALSALVMCVTQNRSQVLQSEQGKLNKYGTMAISVGLSLYLGIFVPAGIGLYWIASNLLSVLQMYLLNAAIDPKKHVDYQALEESRAALAEIENLGGSPDGKKGKDPWAAREKADYKRFFSVVNKHIVFYSEKSGFWKYYRDIIRVLLEKTNVRIHYVTNDPEDQVFEIAKTEPRILPYYIGPKKIITLMMKLEADMVVMTTPDLETYHIKRSYVDKDAFYVYTPHDPMSVHMGFREGAMDHFDAVLCVGPQQIREIRETEKVYSLPEKELIPCGYVLLDDLLADYAAEVSDDPGRRKRILIAPSWSEDNILDSCADELISRLMAEDRLVIVRPHPEYVKRYGPRLEALQKRFADRIGDGLVFETDFTSNATIYTADVMVTDWSGIAYEYAYTTLRPTLFINTKMKAPNPNWQKIGITPLEISLRDQIGVSLDKDRLSHVGETAEEMLRNPGRWADRIRAVRDENIFNLGHCGEAAADYLIKKLSDISTKNKGGSNS